MRSKILLLFAFCVFGVTPAAFAEYGSAITVNCALGQSLSATLSKLPKLFPTTVFVKGTCTEYISINGFTGLTLKGLPGAALQQPSTIPGGGVPVYVVLIQASQSITIDGFAVHTSPSALGGIAIGRNSTDVQLRNVTMDGGAFFGFFIYEESQVSLARVTTNNLGYAVLGAFDVSDVHIESSSFSDGLAGLVVSTGHVTIQTTSIRNIKIGISASNHGEVDIQSFSSYFPISLPTDVVIDNNYHRAVEIVGGAHLALGDTNLLITNAGQTYDSNAAAIWMTDSSSLSDPNGHLRISGSQGQGILVNNNSHATLTGSSVTGGSHGGLVVTNLSSVSIGSGNQTLVGGNSTDLFCDSRSVITGGGNLAGAPITNCTNLLSGDTVPLP
jgi:hypothetical protein